MMPPQRRLVPAALVLSSSATAETQQDPRQITWLEMGFPPFCIPDGKEAGMGIADQVTRVLSERRTGWRHRSEAANPAAIDRVLRGVRPTAEYRGFVEPLLGAELRQPYRDAYNTELARLGAQ